MFASDLPASGLWPLQGEAFEFSMCGAAEATSHLETLPAVEAASPLNQAQYADRFVCAYVEGELAFWEWAELGDIGVPPDALPGAVDGAHTATLFGAHTRPAYRGRGLFTAGCRWLMEALAKQGYGRLCSSVALDNRPSVCAHLSAGMVIVGECGWRTWRGRRRVLPSRRLGVPVGAGHQGALPAGLSPRAARELALALGCLSRRPPPNGG